jgi:hypothetical protein
LSFNFAELETEFKNYVVLNLVADIAADYQALRIEAILCQFRLLLSAVKLIVFVHMLVPGVYGDWQGDWVDEE